MKIIAYHDCSTLYRGESYALCECFDMYFILKIYRDANTEDVYAIEGPCISGDSSPIWKKWNSLGGIKIEAVD